MLTYAIIPARSGSKGVPDKNIRPLGGHPLLAWSIAAAKLTPSISRVIVSTDSEKYAEIARAYGAETPFLRPKEFASDTSSDADFLLHATQWFLENEGTAPNYWVHLRPTTPLREPKLIENAIQTIYKHNATNKPIALRSAHEASESPTKWFRKGNGFFHGFMGDEWLNMPRQQCPFAYTPNGYVDIVYTQTLLQTQSVYVPPLLAFVTPEVPEVDTLYDFEELTFFVRGGHFLLEELNTYKPFEV